MTSSWDMKKWKHIVLASGLGVTFSLTGASYAQAAEGDEPIGLFEENGENMEGQEVGVDSLGQIDITVKDLEIAKVLQLLSIQSQRNIVASRNVSGKVSADLYGVSFHEALEAILTPNGYGYEEKGNFIYVYTAQELEERQKAMRKTLTKIVRLNYISAEDAAAFTTPMLSANGSITASGAVDAGFLPSESDGGENQFAHSDTLLIRDYEENVAEIMDVIAELDVRPKQVLVEATILSARLDEANAFGVDFAVFANFDGLTDFANPLAAVNELIAGQGTGNSGTAVQSTVGNTATGNAGVKVGVTGESGSVFLRALDSVTDTTVLSKPNILVLNRMKADLLVGERLGYLSTTVTDTSETQTVEFLDVGTQLSVRPFITEQGTIRLELRPSVSDGTVTIDSGLVIPNESTQELVTNIIVESGQTVVLGGLFVEDTTVDREQVPILGDVPILGTAFKGQDDTVSRNEIIFMVKTTIMDHADLAVMGEAAEDQITNARIAIRNGLLPFSTDKLVSSHLLDARRQLEAGDTKKALWSVNLALHLSPTSADAIALKEEITGNQIAYENRRQFKDIADGLIDLEMEDMSPMDMEQEPMVEETPEAMTPAQDTPETAQVQEEEPVSTFGPMPIVIAQPDEAAPAEDTESLSRSDDSDTTVIVVDMLDELSAESDEPEVAEGNTEEGAGFNEEAMVEVHIEDEPNFYGDDK